MTKLGVLRNDVHFHEAKQNFGDAVSLDLTTAFGLKVCAHQ